MILICPCPGRTQERDQVTASLSSENLGPELLDPQLRGRQLLAQRVCPARTLVQNFLISRWTKKPTKIKIIAVLAGQVAGGQEAVDQKGLGQEAVT